MNQDAALDGVLVADFSRVLAGPYLTMLLADLGATVIKVEGPAGDTTRKWGPPWHRGASTYYASVNRNKRSVVLDLADPRDYDLADELARRADILVENFMPGRLSKFGLGYEHVAAGNPGIVYCSISGFGSQGSGAALPGYDLLGQAAGGLMSITGAPEGPPSKVGVALVDILCGLHGAIGVLAALRHRSITGRGQHVEVDLLSSILSALSNQAAGYLLAGHVPAAMGNAHPSVSPYESYEASDGSLVIAVGTDRQFAEMCTALRLESLAADARFVSNEARVANRELLRAEIEDALTGLTRKEALERLRSRDVPCAAVNDVAEAFAYARELGLDPVWEVDGDAHARSPIRLSHTPPRAYGPAPDLDEQGDDIRSWLERPLRPSQHVT